MAVEFLHPSPRMSKELPGRLSTTARLCELLKIDMPDLEIVSLEKDKYLAYDMHGFGKRHAINGRATLLLKKARPGPIEVYGLAVVYSTRDIL
jgi:hypothetical protein